MNEKNRIMYNNWAAAFWEAILLFGLIWAFYLFASGLGMFILRVWSC